MRYVNIICAIIVVLFACQVVDAEMVKRQKVSQTPAAYQQMSSADTGDVGVVQADGYVAGVDPATIGSIGVAGSDTWVQYNDGGVFGAEANLTYDKVANLLTADNIVGNSTIESITFNAGNATTTGVTRTFDGFGNSISHDYDGTKETFSDSIFVNGDIDVTGGEIRNGADQGAYAIQTTGDVLGNNYFADNDMTAAGDVTATQNTITGGVHYTTEQAAASADIAGQGQDWVKNTTPNERWFTNDVGTDFQLGKPDTYPMYFSLNNAALTADGYMDYGGVPGSALYGWPVPIAGSITGVSVKQVSVFGAGGVWDVEVWVSNANVWSAITLSDDGTETNVKNATQAAGTDSVAVTDYIGIFLNETTDSDRLTFPLVTLTITKD